MINLFLLILFVIKSMSPAPIPFCSTTCAEASCTDQTITSCTACRDPFVRNVASCVLPTDSVSALFSKSADVGGNMTSSLSADFDCGGSLIYGGATGLSISFTSTNLLTSGFYEMRVFVFILIMDSWATS